MISEMFRQARTIHLFTLPLPFREVFTSNKSSEVRRLFTAKAPVLFVYITDSDQHYDLRT